MKTSATPAQPVRAGNTSAGHRASLCTALGELKSTLAATPSGAFDLANCAEINGRDAEAVKLLEKYLEMSPEALDRKEIHMRIADLKSLLALPGQKGIEVRRVYASLYGSLAERSYDRSLANLNKAAVLDPDFPFDRMAPSTPSRSPGQRGPCQGKFRALPAIVARSKAPKTRPPCI